MAVITIDNFKLFENIDKTRSIIINPNNIEECMDFYYQNKLEGVTISEHFGYNLNNIDFLKDYQDIKKIVVSDNITNIDGLYFLKNLEELSIATRNLKFDFGYFPNLKTLNFNWGKEVLNLNLCKKLETLIMYYGFNPKSKNLELLSDLYWLKHLKINNSTIISFEGSDNFDRLESLEFNYCSKLENITGFKSSEKTLKSILLQNCKSIKNHEYVQNFKRLNELAFNDSGVIKDLSFVKKLKELKSFRFMGVDVENGDISPCIGINYVAFTNKKHFSHKMEDFKK